MEERGTIYFHRQMPYETELWNLEESPRSAITKARTMETTTEVNVPLKMAVSCISIFPVSPFPFFPPRIGLLFTVLFDAVLSFTERGVAQVQVFFWKPWL